MGKPVFNPYGMDPGFRSTYDPYNEEEKIVICPKCGAEIPDGETKCPKCGKKSVREDGVRKKKHARGSRK